MYITVKQDLGNGQSVTEEFDTDAYLDYEEFCQAVLDFFADDDDDGAEDERDATAIFEEVFKIVGVHEDVGGEQNIFDEDLESYWTSGYAELDEDEKEVVMAYYENVGGKFDSHMIAEAQENYIGYFERIEKFARQMAEDVQGVNNASWPFNCIDWEQAGKELMHDYFENDDHYFRNV